MQEAKEEESKVEAVPQVEQSCDDCSICFDDFTSANPASETSCGHQFHYQCILQWQERSNCCPMCWTPFGLDGEAPPTVARNPTSTQYYSSTRLLSHSTPDHFQPADLDIIDELSELLRRAQMVSHGNGSRPASRHPSASSRPSDASIDSDLRLDSQPPAFEGFSSSHREARSRSSDPRPAPQQRSNRPSTSALSRIRGVLHDVRVRSTRHFGRRDRSAQSEISPTSSPSTSPAVSPTRGPAPPNIHSIGSIPSTPPKSSHAFSKSGSSSSSSPQALKSRIPNSSNSRMLEQ